MRWVKYYDNRIGAFMINNLFPFTIISLFLFASIVCFFVGEVAKGLFYFLSAMINLVVLYL